MAPADADFDDELNDEFDDELDDDQIDDSESESNDYTVSEFVDEINFALDDAFSSGVWVTGEIEGFKTPKPHYYFDLIEKGDNGNSVKLPASIWGGVANKLMPKLRNAGVEFKNGIKVRVHGRVDYYGPFGKLSLKVDDIDPNFTIGEVQAEREALLRKLKEEGAFAVNKEHEVPLVPLRIGVVTGNDSAAWHDMLATFKASGIGFHIAVCNALVQGERCPDEVVAGIKTLDKRDDLDVIVVARGGGSKGDLAGFDAEIVARAIVATSRPVFVAVGHEVDTSVADFVAHTSFKTPTACAEHLVNTVQAFIDDVDKTASEIADVVANILDRGLERLAALSTHIRNRAVISANHAEGKLDMLAQRISGSATTTVSHCALKLEGYEARLRLLDPINTMKRGWSITRGADGKVITDLKSVKPGEKITTEVVGGSIDSTIDSVSKD